MKPTSETTGKLRLQNPSAFDSPSSDIQVKAAAKWTKGVCPNCSYANADVDPEGVISCPACGYSKKGCYT